MAELEEPPGMDESSNLMTWQAFVALALPMMAVPIIVTWLLLSSHGGQPHVGAVRQNQLISVMEQMKSIRDDVREIRLLLIEASSRRPITVPCPEDRLPE